MGQAKHRGTFEDRLASASEQPNGNTTKQDLKDVFSYIATVMDRSEAGTSAIDLTARTFPQFKAASERFEPAYQFVIFVRGKNETDQGVLFVRDLQMLIDEGIPAVLRKVASVGGSCGFILAVDQAVLDPIESVVASASNTEAPQKSR